MRPLVLEMEVGDLAPGGDGVAIAEIGGERRAVFISGVARGERVKVEVDASKRPARGRVLDVLTPSADRVASPCAWVERCGGCDWMHLAPTEQVAAHGRIVAALLRAEVAETHAAPTVLGYRTRARVHVEATRRAIVVGMFGRRSHAPAEVDRCVVLDPAIERARSELGAWLAGARGRGEARVSLGSPSSDPRRAVIDLQWKGDPLPAEVFARFERAIAQGDTLGGVRIFAEGVRRPATIGDPTPFVMGADGVPLRLAPGGFSQASEAGNAVLVRRVAELSALAPGSCVELYAGAGNLTVMLARTREVVAVEQDADACAAARANLDARDLTARIVTSDAKDFAIPRTTRLVVLDPPRDGARAVAEALAARAHARPAILYVACDPATLARDVRILVDGGYAVRRVETFEMFPNTSHVETVVTLEPKA